MALLPRDHVNIPNLKAPGYAVRLKVPLQGPPPRLNLLRYHEMLWPLRPTGVRSCRVRKRRWRLGARVMVSRPPPSIRHRLAWAVLLARVFDVTVSLTPDCGGPMKIVAALPAPEPRKE
jgi:hypothetical protein